MNTDKKCLKFEMPKMPKITRTDYRTIRQHDETTDDGTRMSTNEALRTNTERLGNLI